MDREKALTAASPAGVHVGRTLRAWPIFRPRDMLDLLPQLADKLIFARPRSNRPEIRRVVEQLDREGVAVLERVGSASLIEAARQDVDHFVRNIEKLEGTSRTKRGSTGGTVEYPVHEFQRGLNVYRSHDPLMFSPAYARFLLLPELREVAAGYLGRSWLYQAMIATRTLPSAPTKDGFAQWHHDARGRKLNVILPLTDVSSDGSATIVLAGSQRLVYSRDRRKRNMFSDEEVATLRQQHGWTERLCDAPAGSLVFFDSQALHLGRRSSESRDAFQVNCMTKRRHLWPQEVPQMLFDGLAPGEQRELLRRSNLRVV